VTQAFVVVGALFLLVFVPLGVLAGRRPLLARFALRESTRRKGQFALLVVGLMAGTASITAALVASDTQIQMLTSIWTQQLGAVDLTVTGTGGRPFSTDVAQRLAADPALTPYVDGVQAGLEIHASIADLDQTLGKPDVLLVGFDPASQRRFGAFDLGGGHSIYGSELAQGDVLLSIDLASALDARVGDRLRVSAGSGRPTDLRVYGIAARKGPGVYSGLYVGYGGPLTAYLPLGTAQLVTGNSDINVVRVAARGGSTADVKPALLAAPPLRAAVARIQSATSLTVNEARVELERQAAATTANTTGTNLAFSLLIALAAMALIVNLVIALAEERRPRLAVLRALGLSRAELVVTSILEGAVYSLASGIAGVVVGVPAGIYLAQQEWNTILLDPGSRIAGLPLQLTIRPGTLAFALAAGALLTLATVAATAFRTSRMAISAAIRDLPEPAPAPGRRWPRIALLLALALVGAGLIVPDYAPGRLVGGFLLIASAAGLARGRLPDWDRATVFGLAITALTAITVAAYIRSLSDPNQLVVVLVLAVVMPAVGLSIAAAANLRWVDAGLGRLGNRFSQIQAALRPPLAYLSRRPLRTGLAAIAFAIVLALTTVLAVFAGSVGFDYNRESAGFDILAVSSAGEPIQLPPEVEQQVTGRMTLPIRIYRGPLSGTGYIGSHSWAEMTFYVLPDYPRGGGPVALDNLDRRFPSSSDAWQAVRNEPNLVIGTGGASPGDEVVVAGKSGPLHLRLAAVPSSFILNGIVASATTIANLDTTPAGSTVLLTLRPGANSRALAHEIERAGFAQGVQATSIRDMLDQDVASSIAWTTQLDGLLHMGLLVGVLALAMIGLRAAVERRRPIGILRALGYQPPSLLVGLLAEAALLATLGVLAGVGGGLVIAYFVRDIAVPPGTPFSVDLPRVAIALAIVYSTVVLVTGPLASRAARLAPAEAVRLIG
jgi:ABC-type lipoprotein release transport system permease subunit